MEITHKAAQKHARLVEPPILRRPSFCNTVLRYELNGNRSLRPRACLNHDDEINSSAYQPQHVAKVNSRIWEMRRPDPQDYTWTGSAWTPGRTKCINVYYGPGVPERDATPAAGPPTPACKKIWSGIRRPRAALVPH